MSLAYCLMALPAMAMAYIFFSLPHTLTIFPSDLRFSLWLNYAVTFAIWLGVSLVVGWPLFYACFRVCAKFLSPVELERLRSALAKVEV